MKSRFWFSGAVLAVIVIGLFVRFWRHEPDAAPATKAVSSPDKIARAAKTNPNQLSLGEWFGEASRRLREYDREHPRALVASPRNFAGRDATEVSTHPAWQLAARLNGDSRLAFTSTTLVSPDVNAALLGNGDISGLNRFSPSRGATFGDGFGANESALQRWLDGGGQNGVTVFARELGRLNREAQNKQSASLSEFLLTSAARQEARRGQIGDSLRAALRDDVEMAKRLDPGALEPFVPTESEALRLINLRLDLLNTLRTPEAQKDAAAAERLERETAFRAALREQELERRRLLIELQTTLPARLATQRQTALENTLRTLSQNDASARESAIVNGRELIAQDFTARNARLGIALPSRAPRNGANNNASGFSASTSDEQSDQNRTRRAQVPSNADTFALGAVESGNFEVPRGNFSDSDDVVVAATSGQLARDLARDDVRQWQRIAARRQRAWQRVGQNVKRPVASQTKSSAR